MLVIAEWFNRSHKQLKELMVIHYGRRPPAIVLIAILPYLAVYGHRAITKVNWHAPEQYLAWAVTAEYDAYAWFHFKAVVY